MGAETPGGQGDGASVDRCCDALANVRRRRAVTVLRDVDGAVSVATLAKRVSADAPAGDDSRVRDVAIDLSHVHLPKLADAGVVDYDASAGTVEYRGGPTVEALLDAVEETAG